jgi:hypothetical protein
MMTGPRRPQTELVIMAPTARATVRFSSAMSGASRFKAEPSVAFWAAPAVPSGLLSA